MYESMILEVPDVDSALRGVIRDREKTLLPSRSDEDGLE